MDCGELGYYSLHSSLLKSAKGVLCHALNPAFQKSFPNSWIIFFNGIP